MYKKPLDNRDLNSFDSESSSQAFLNSFSFTDCTGLIPSMPQTQAEKDAYREICSYEPRPSDKKIRKNDPIEM
jgi:hypothetical protein